MELTRILSSIVSLLVLKVLSLCEFPLGLVLQCPGWCPAQGSSGRHLEAGQSYAKENSSRGQSSHPLRELAAVMNTFWPQAQCFPVNVLFHSSSDLGDLGFREDEEMKWYRLSRDKGQEIIFPFSASISLSVWDKFRRMWYFPLFLLFQACDLVQDLTNGEFTLWRE